MFIDCWVLDWFHIVFCDCVMHLCPFCNRRTINVLDMMMMMKQGSAADRVDFISHLRRKWTLASVAFHACKMIVLAILTKSPLQRTSNTWPGPTLWVRRRCFILWWRRYGFCYRPDFQRDCGAVVQHLYILFFVSIGSQMLQCTEVDVPKLSIFWPVCVPKSYDPMFRNGPWHVPK